MQKGKNVIRALVTIVFVINTSLAQKKLEGTFCIDYELKYSSTCLEFINEKDFFYSIDTDVGRSYYAKGVYELSKDRLILDYNKTAPLKMSYHVSEIWKSNKDSITVDFNLFDFDRNPAINVNIFYRDILSPKGYITNVSNSNGKVSFKLKKDTTDLQFEISSMDYGLTTSIAHSFYNLTIYKGWNYRISVYLQKSYTGIPLLNQTDTLNIVKRKRKYFTVKNKNGSITTWRKLDD